jgi:hypothetical protein
MREVALSSAALAAAASSAPSKYVNVSVQVTCKQATVYDAQLGVKLVTILPRACYILMK